MTEKEFCDCEKPMPRHVGCHPTSCVRCGKVVG